MSEAGFASLGPTLLARKGGAKPAMRPQLAPLVAAEKDIETLADEQLEDLGWNDMGHDDGAESDDENGADVVPINAAVAASDAAAAAHNPIVRRQQRRLEERVLAEAVMTGPEDSEDEVFDEFGEAGTYQSETDTETAEDSAEVYAAPPPPAPVAPAPVSPVVARRKPRAPVLAASERRAAFTLRLDPERHLKLRLAATMQGVSAQALLTEALDAMLAEFDDLDVIAAHLKRH